MAQTFDDTYSAMVPWLRYYPKVPVKGAQATGLGFQCAGPPRQCARRHQPHADAHHLNSAGRGALTPFPPHSPHPPGQADPPAKAPPRPTLTVSDGASF
jgi:hypothetical protein